jgi:hypothetical protein
LSKVTPGAAQPPGARADGGSGWRVRFDDDDDLEAAPARALRLVPRQHGPLTAEAGERAA